MGHLGLAMATRVQRDKDPEMATIAKVLRVLAKLDAEAKLRVLDYVRRRVGTEAAAGGGGGSSDVTAGGLPRRPDPKL